MFSLLNRGPFAVEEFPYYGTVGVTIHRLRQARQTATPLFSEINRQRTVLTK